MSEKYDEVDTFLEHYGVKGMKWGVRKERGTSRKERRAEKKENKTPSRRALKKEQRRAEIEKKANNIIQTSLKDDTALVKLNGTMILTGKEFIQYAASGGSFNIKRTEVYTATGPKGEYVIKR